LYEMIPAQFEYFRASDIQEAVSFLSTHDDAKILAGGHSLIPLMRLRIASPKYLVDITRIEELSQIKDMGDRIVIGALTTHSLIESSALIKRHLEALSEGASKIGDRQVRNFGTIGGSLAHNDPSADYPAIVLALDAEMKASGPDGTRSIPADEFFLDTFSTSLKPQEILTWITFPKQPENSGSCYMKFERKAGDFAIVGVAAYVELGKNGSLFHKVRVGLTSLAPKAVRATSTENFLAGKPVKDEHVREGAALVAKDIQPSSDLRGSARYKTEMAKVFARRALETAIKRARGEEGKGRR
jgi:carbon-monoxide dehydrogenase medium subunit